MAEYIDRETLKNYLDCEIDFGGIDNRFMVLSKIDEVPTADVVERSEYDKMVKYLKAFFSICEKYGVTKEDLFSKEEDSNLCYYHINDKDKLVICGCTQEPIASTFSWFNEQTSEYKYCPYRGKEICF